jgi:hypothetical protein
MLLWGQREWIGLETNRGSSNPAPVSSAAAMTGGYY